jgi:hypothetical protein
MPAPRHLTPEHMDDPHASPQDLAAALRYLRTVNARLGGTKAALRQFQRWARDWPQGDARGPIRILDIGAGSCDIPLAIARWARQAGHRVCITAVDRHPVTCGLAREFLAAHGGEAAADITIVQEDALRLTEGFEAGAFDYAHAGLFLHHLRDVEVMTALRIMQRLSMRGVIWNDLVRVMWPRVMLWPALIGAPAIVRHDAIVSVQAGFTRSEAMDMARRVGWRSPRWRRHLVHRFTLVSDA